MSLRGGHGRSAAAVHRKQVSLLASAIDAAGIEVPPFIREPGIVVDVCAASKLRGALLWPQLIDLPTAGANPCFTIGALTPEKSEQAIPETGVLVDRGVEFHSNVAKLLGSQFENRPDLISCKIGN
jgi:hypothetical protein